MCTSAHSCKCHRWQKQCVGGTTETSYILTTGYSRLGVRRGSAAARGFQSRRRNDFFSCERCVLSGRGLCDELITRPEESYRLWRIVPFGLETSRMWWPWPALGCGTTERKNMVEDIDDDDDNNNNNNDHNNSIQHFTPYSDFLPLLFCKYKRRM